MISDKDRFFNTLEKISERASEVSHEERLANIRSRSHALVWTGTAEDLVAAITKWFESGLIVASSLQEALHLASIHFSDPMGMPVIRRQHALQEVRQITPPVFSHSPRYRKITFAGKEYDLAKHRYAPEIIRVLHEAHDSGDGGLTTIQIRKLANLPHNGNMYDWLRGTGLWKSLVVTAGPDLYSLDI